MIRTLQAKALQMNCMPFLCATVLIHLIVSASVFASVHQAYEVLQAGFVGPGYQRTSDSREFSDFRGFNDQGQTIGFSSRYDGEDAVGRAAWLADRHGTVRIGFYDNEYRGGNGYEYSSANFINQNGQALGTSNVYLGDTNASASSNLRVAWIADSSGTTQVGLTGNEYERHAGFGYISVQALNASGQAIGQSTRYGDIGLPSGYIAWIGDTYSTVRLGLSGGDYVRDDGYERSLPQSLNDAGYAIGYSERFHQSNFAGRAAWIANESTATRVGFFGNEYRSPADGYTEYSEAQFLNANNQAVGFSRRYEGIYGNGQSAWIADTTGTTNLIGLTGDGFHRETDGYEFNEAVALNNQNQAAGVSLRFNGDKDRGQAAWIADTTATTRIGLFSGQYQRPGDGFQFSDVVALNQSGQSIGNSTIYYDASSRAYTGSAAWIADANGTTTRIGLTGTEFQRNFEGGQYSQVLGLTDTGYAAGYSHRFNGDQNVGAAAWVADTDVTMRVGLFGEGYQDPTDGREFTRILSLNSAGQAIGTSDSFDGSTRSGRAAWFYDSSTGVSSELAFSFDPDGRNSFTFLSALSDDGTVFGSYDLYSGSERETRLFAWSLGEGLTDLSDRVMNLTENGWDRLLSVAELTDDGTLFGKGQRPGITGSSTFVLTEITSITGDYNADGLVSQSDLDLVLLNWGDAVVPAGFDEDALPGGGPFDGLIGQNELDGVLLNWRSGTSPAANAIPEPGVAMLLGVGIIGLTRRGRVGWPRRDSGLPG